MNTREIKFRGKSNLNNQFVYGDLIKIHTKNGSGYGIKNTPYHINDNCVNLIPDEIIPETVGQYTGLKDKNGVEIYEGDIVDWVDSDYYIRRDVVRWINGGLVLCNNSYTVGSYPQNKVIGNIHDNPELLNNEKPKLTCYLGNDIINQTNKKTKVK